MNELIEQAESIVADWNIYQRRIRDRRAHDRGTHDRRLPQAVMFAKLLLLQLKSGKRLDKRY